MFPAFVCMMVPRNPCRKSEMVRIIRNGGALHSFALMATHFSCRDIREKRASFSWKRIACLSNKLQFAFLSRKVPRPLAREACSGPLAGDVTWCHWAADHFHSRA